MLGSIKLRLDFYMRLAVKTKGMEGLPPRLYCTVSSWSLQELDNYCHPDLVLHGADEPEVDRAVGCGHRRPAVPHTVEVSLRPGDLISLENIFSSS